ncbi:MAG: hypothetical protein EOP40_12555 [Rubrivivax sp.]|nr:MAG: hypothetical protein EOP40_12555 [Rubrivivax sp.]
MSPSLKISRSALAAASVFAALCALPAASMAQADAPASSAQEALPIVPPEGAGQYYIVTRADRRQCVAPGCGGYYVKAVNQLLTLCADGSKQYDCHAYKLDTLALGLNEKQLEALTKHYGSGKALVRGELTLVPLSDTARFSVTGLIASEAWLGQGLRKPVGSFYNVKDNGVRCITYPCPSYNEHKLNTRQTRAIAGIDLTHSGAAQERIDAGFQALTSPGGLLAAGVHTVITGPAGRGTQLLASEFYLPLVGDKP